MANADVENAAFYHQPTAALVQIYRAAHVLELISLGDTLYAEAATHATDAMNATLHVNVSYVLQIADILASQTAVHNVALATALNSHATVCAAYAVALASLQAVKIAAAPKSAATALATAQAANTTAFDILQAADLSSCIALQNSDILSINHIHDATQAVRKAAGV